MKKIRLLLIAVMALQITWAQPLTREQIQELNNREDSLKRLAREIVWGKTSLARFNADSTFTRQFVRALRTPNSFYYSFDSLLQVSRIYAPDSSFRIFTWQMVINDNLTRQHGAIQLKTSDGSLKLFPLIDKSDVTEQLTDTAGNNRGWIGAVYYKIIETRSSNQPYYTLLGYDENNIRSNRKIIEVMSFKNDEPWFGGRFFSFEKDTVFKSSTSRHILEYKKDAGARLVYDPELKMIVFDHLISETNEPQKKWTYIPDGDYEGFVWENGKWVHVEKIFTQVTPEGKEPVPQPLQEVNGDPLLDKVPATGTKEPAPQKKGKG